MGTRTFLARIFQALHEMPTSREQKAQGPPSLAALVVSEKRADQAVRRRRIFDITPSPPSKPRRTVEGSGTTWAVS